MIKHFVVFCSMLDIFQYILVFVRKEPVVDENVFENNVLFVMFKVFHYYFINYYNNLLEYKLTLQNSSFKPSV